MLGGDTVDKFRIIDFNECQAMRVNGKKGMGGVRWLVKIKDKVVYVVKFESSNQTLNEIMAQIIIKSLGLCSIEYAFVLINETHYGALRYLKGINPFRKDKLPFALQRTKD